MYFAYILINQTRTKTYSGHTNKLKGRFDLHNNGRGGRFTKLYGPWSILYFEKFELEIESIKEKNILSLLQVADG